MREWRLLASDQRAKAVEVERGDEKTEGTLPPGLTEVIRAFDRSGLPYCVVGNPRELASAEGKSGLLINNTDLTRARRMLKAHRFFPIPTAKNHRHLSFVSYCGATDRWEHLRLYRELSYGAFGSARTRTEQACLARRQREGELFLLHPDDRFWTALLEMLFNAGPFDLNDVSALKTMVHAAGLDGPLARVVDRACPAGTTAERLVDWIRLRDWTSLELIGPSLYASWLRRPRFARPDRLVTGPIMATLRTLTPKRRMGLTVALLGPDGCGKSTLADRIEQSYIFPVQLVYMGLWRPADFSKKRWLPGLSFASRVFTAWRKYLVGQYHRMLGRLVIFDRYTYDALLPPDSRPSVLSRMYSRVLGHICPAPQLVLLLDAPGTTMYARKHESTPEQLEAQRQGFLQLQHSIRGLEVIDATRSPKAVYTDVIDRIWGHYFGH